MSFAKSLQNPSAKDAVGRAYAQYVTDDRLDTDADEEAFGDALYTHVIDVIEDTLKAAVLEVGLGSEVLDDFRLALGL